MKKLSKADRLLMDQVKKELSRPLFSWRMILVEDVKYCFRFAGVLFVIPFVILWCLFRCLLRALPLVIAIVLAVLILKWIGVIA